MTHCARTLVCLALLVLLGACTGSPVRHLASDAALIKPGVSTRDEVLTYLGDPDSRQTISDTAERWVYYEERQSTLQQAPYLGKLFNAKGYEQIVVTLEGDSVVDVGYSSFDADEYGWSEDFGWQEKRE